MISEFEKILDEADKAIGNEQDAERLFCEVYYLMNGLKKNGRTVSLQQVIFYAQQFEVTQNLRKPCVDSTMATIEAMGTTHSVNPAMSTFETKGATISRAERRYMEKMEKKSGSKSATKKRKKR